MANVGSAERAFREASDGKHATALGDPLDERQPGCDLCGGRAAVRRRDARAVRMRRHEVPEQHVAAIPSSASVRWTIVALSSAGPMPVSCRSEVNAIPETLAPL
jgi:hypothetical protein